MPYRIKISLLALGVVLGYGSAIGRAWYGHGWYHHARHPDGGCHEHHEAPVQPRTSPKTPASKTPQSTI
jgi:hypothetical protein